MNHLILSLSPYPDYLNGGDTLNTVSNQLKELPNSPQGLVWLHQGSAKIPMPDGFGFLQDILVHLKKHDVPYTAVYQGSDFVYSSSTPKT